MKSRPPLAPLDAMQRYEIPEVLAYLRCSRKTVYADIKQGRLASFKDGRRRYVHGHELIRRSQATA